MPQSIEEVMQEIERLFANYNRDTRAFTVDYDESTDGLYCNYVPYINDSGYAVSDDLLVVGETSEKDLKKLKEFLEQNNIRSRLDCEWSAAWGWGEA